MRETINITRGTDVLLNDRLLFRGSTFDPSLSVNVEAHLVSRAGVRTSLGVEVVDDYLVISVPWVTGRVAGLYGLEVRGVTNGLRWATYADSLIRYTNSTVQGDASDVTQTADAYDITQQVSYRYGESPISEVRVEVDDSIGTPGVSVSYLSRVLSLFFSGLKPNSLVSLVQTAAGASDGGVNTWTATLADGTVATLTVRNGSRGNGIASVERVAESSEDGGVSTWRVTESDGRATDISVRNGSRGNGIASVERVAESDADGGVNTWRMTESDGRVTDISVRNGRTGKPGDSVLVGEGDLPLANTLGTANDKAITQKAVSDEFSKTEYVLKTLDTSDPLFIANAYRNESNGGGGSANGYARTRAIALDEIFGTMEVVTTLTSWPSASKLFAVVYNSTSFSASTFLGSINIKSTKTITRQQILDAYPTAAAIIITIYRGSSTAFTQETVDTWYLERTDSYSKRLAAAENSVSANTESISNLGERATEIGGDVASNRARIGNVETELEGLTIGDFEANKYIVAGGSTYGNSGSANGYARGPVMDVSNNYGTLALKGVPSMATVNLFAYSSTATVNHSTCLGFVAISRTFNPQEIMTQQGWSNVACIRLSMAVSAGTALSQDEVDSYQLQRIDTLGARMDTLEDNVGDLQEQVEELTGNAKKGTLHYDASAGATSYVENNIATSNKIKVNFKVARAGANWGSGNNPQFNFSSVELDGTSVHSCSEEATPSKFNYSYLGGNHGDSAIRNVTAASHGKTYADIGSTWRFMRGSTAVNLTLIGIAGENTLIMIGANSSTYPKWHFGALNVGETGTITHVSGATNTGDISFTSVSVGQLRNALVIASKNVYVDGKEVTESGDYSFSKLEICENYDILNTASIVQKIQEKVGTFTDNPDLPSLGADKVARHSLVYTFVGADLWFINKTLTFYQDVNMTSDDETLFVMSQIISGSSIKMYIPKALAIGSTDFRTIASFGSVSSEITIPTGKWEDANLPPDRFLQYSSAIGHETGYLFDYGIGGSNRKDCISNAFRITTARKVYPMGIDGSNVSHNAGDSYSAVSFRKYFLPTSINQNGVICNAVFEYDNKLYIYADYNAAGIYEIDIPAKFLGKKVEVFEKRENVKLLTTVSASKLLVKVDEDDVMYGYLVAQIK